MSKRNTQEAKRAARDRLRIEREQQAKKEKLRRQLTVAGAVVATLAVATGIGVAVVNMTGASGWEAAAEAKLVKPAHTSGKNGTEIILGEKDAKNVLEVYEDPRCPTCAAFEQASGEVLAKDLEEGKYQASFTLATFIDRMAKGDGSKNAVSALGAALNVSEDAFLEYKTALYSKKWHPEESEDKFAEDSYLLEIAEDVDALKGNKKFEEALKSGTYDRWALEMSEAFDDSGVTGTPTFKMDGKKLQVPDAPDPRTPIITPQQFNAAVDKALG